MPAALFVSRSVRAAFAGFDTPSGTLSDRLRNLRLHERARMFVVALRSESLPVVRFGCVGRRSRLPYSAIVYVLSLTIDSVV
jgi:hypothetical protein